MARKLRYSAEKSCAPLYSRRFSSHALEERLAYPDAHCLSFPGIQRDERRSEPCMKRLAVMFAERIDSCGEREVSLPTGDASNRRIEVDFPNLRSTVEDTVVHTPVIDATDREDTAQPVVMRIRVDEFDPLAQALLR